MRLVASNFKGLGQAPILDNKAAVPSTGTKAYKPGKAVVSLNQKADTASKTNPVQASPGLCRLSEGSNAIKAPTLNSQARVGSE